MDSRERPPGAGPRRFPLPPLPHELLGKPAARVPSPRLHLMWRRSRWDECLLEKHGAIGVDMREGPHHEP
ncbi:MAG: hypothetical protein QG597_1782 [Actinomycetota bacterium]|nr:hypothetical protein [Actinomycetota bacterium]